MKFDKSEHKLKHKNDSDLIKYVLGIKILKLVYPHLKIFFGEN